MAEDNPYSHKNDAAKQALLLWGVFFITAILLNGTIPFLFGADLHAWTFSPLKDVLFNLLVYSGLFLVAPLALTKGRSVLRQPGFWLPLLLAVAGITLHTFFRPAAALVVIVLAYLHYRYDLSALGFRSFGWKEDAAVILCLVLISLIPALLQPPPHTLLGGSAWQAGLERLFANPASTTEYLFYFGFLGERLLPRLGRWPAALLLALLYTLHELSNPEYWYGGTLFVLIFFGILIIAALYLWRRNVTAIWLGDGLGRFASRLF
jgi:hypothetical protein